MNTINKHNKLSESLKVKQNLVISAFPFGYDRINSISSCICAI